MSGTDKNSNNNSPWAYENYASDASSPAPSAPAIVQAVAVSSSDASVITKEPSAPSASAATSIEGQVVAGDSIKDGQSKSSAATPIEGQVVAGDSIKDGQSSPYAAVEVQAFSVDTSCQAQEVRGVVVSSPGSPSSSAAALEVPKEPAHPEGFAIGLFEMGETMDCMLACFCPCIALSLARSSFDGSTCLFNCCCLNSAVARWAVRTGYGIDGGGYVDDIILPCLCIPCSANQVYQTTKRYGPLVTGGRQQNTNDWLNPVSKGFDCGSCCYAFFCPQCAVGSALSDSMGMPWVLGCLCGNCYGARNLMRYHYRIRGADMQDDCFVPVCQQGCCFLGGLLCSALTFGMCSPCIMPLTAGPIVAFQMTLLQEARSRSLGLTPGGSLTEDRGRYIAGYTTVSRQL